MGKYDQKKLYMRTFFTQCMADFLNLLIGDPTNDLIISAPNPNSVSLLTAKKLDYETKNRYDLRIKATNFEETALTGISPYETVIDFRINVLDINDNPPTFTQELYSTNVPEDYGIGLSIAKVSASDADSGDVITYKLVGNVSADLFTINSTTGEVTLAKALDRETRDDHTVFVQASDGLFTTVAELVVRVSDVNDNDPTFTDTGFDMSVSEAQLTNTVIVKIIATDPDLGTNSQLVYTINSGNNEGKFSLNPVTGNLTLIQKLDFEGTKTYNLEIDVRDSANPQRFSPSRLPVTIRVTDVNDNNPIFTPSQYNDRIPESTAVGTSVLTVTVADADGTVLNNQLTLSIPDPVASDYFNILSSGEIRVRQTLNYDAIKEFRFSVQAEDANPTEKRYRAALVNISIDDTDNHRPVFQNTPKTISISEATSIGTSVYRMITTDRDSVGTIKYRIQSGDGGKFRINSETGEIILTDNVDFESATKQYILVIQANDSVGDAAQAGIVTIIIQDYNDNEPVFVSKYYNFAVSEAASQDTIVNGGSPIAATDRDSTTNAQIDYSILYDANNPAVPNQQNSKFRIDQNGLIYTTANANLNFETVQQYTFTVVATDRGTPETLLGTAEVVINVQDADDNQPVWTPASYSVQVKESVFITTNLVTLTATDPDTVGTVAYSIQAGNDESKFAVIGDKIRVVGALDYETTQSYTLTVRARDSGGNIATPDATVTITVIEVNDNRPRITDTDSKYLRVMVQENLAPNSLIVKLNGSDGDRGAAPNQRSNEFQFVSLENTTDFTINSATGEIRNTIQLDYERQNVYSLVATIRDLGTPYLESSYLVDIVVGNENDEPPAFNPTTYSITLSEKAPIGAVIADLIASDPDTPSNQLRYYPATNLDNHFELNTNTGRITLRNSFDKETTGKNGPFILFLVVSDGVTNSSQATVTVSVQDVNDNQPLFTLQEYVLTVDENKAIGTPLTTVTVNDNDNSSTHRNFVYTIQGEDSSNFRLNRNIVEGVPLDGNRLETNKVFDFEVDKRVYTFYVVANNTASEDKLTGKALVRVTVIDVNDNNPQLAPSGIIDLNITEATIAPASVITIFATDNDATSNAVVEFSLSGDPTNAFTINAQTGVISLVKDLDSFVQDTYTLSVIGTDRGTPPRNSAATVVRIKVLPAVVAGLQVNNCPLSFNISEDASPNTFSYTLTTSSTGLPGTSVTYIVAAGASDIQNLFSVSSTGVITNGPTAANYEVRNIYNFLVSARNNRGAVGYCYIKATILDVNEAPSFKSASYIFNVLENTPLNSVVFSVKANDPDFENTVNGQLTYSIQGTSGASFDIDPNNGQIKVNNSLDYETNQQLSFNVVATDGNGRADSAVVVVNLLDWNDNRPIFYPDTPVTVNVNENTRLSNLFTVFANDTDSTVNAQIEYAIYPTGIIAVDASTGVASVIGDLDFEGQQIYDFLVVAKDKGIPYLSRSKEVTLTVLPVNDNSPYFENPSYVTSISEKTLVGMEVIRLTAKDKDRPPHNTIGNYIIISGNSAQNFAINSDGIITVAESVDLSDNGNSNQYNLTVRAIDTGGRSSVNTTTVIINVINLSETQPFFNQDYYVISIAENTAPSTSLLTVEADSNEPTANLQYSIVADSNNLDYQSFTIVNTNEIRNNIGFDYEMKRYYSFEVRVTDTNNGRTNKALVVVMITDINDNNPVEISGKRVFNISEHTMLGQTVGALYGNDSDDGINKEFEFSIVEGNGQTKFKVLPTGEIILKDYVSAQEQSTYQLVVRIRDKGTPSLQNFVNLVFNVQSSQASTSANNPTIPEDQSTLTTITIVTAIDPDTGNSTGFLYSLVGSVSNSLFNINPQSGALSLKVSADYESDKTLTAVVKAEGPTSTGVAEVIVTITDVNDNNPSFDVTGYVLSLNENMNIGQEIVRVRASDRDSALNGNNIIQYKILSVNPATSGLFTIDPNSGVISLLRSFDRENSISSYTISVGANDLGAGNLESTNQVTIIVNVLDINDNYPIFGKPLYQASVMENSTVDTSVATVSAIDGDVLLKNRNLTYSITQPFASQKFKINPITGVISLKAPLDYENITRYDFSVIATDTGDVSYTRTANVEITVLDIPDVKPQFNPFNYEITIPESTLISTSVLQLKEIGSANNLNFQLKTGNTAQDFSLVSSSGEILVAKSLDRERTTRYVFVIGVTDGFNAADTDATVIINIADVNDNQPTFSNPQCYANSLLEGTSVGTSIATALATDRDSGSNANVTYSFSPSCDAFNIDPITGVITTKQELDYEAARSHTCIIKASDQGSPALSGSSCVILNVIDANDLIPTFEITAYSVSVHENRHLGSIISRVLATDGDTLANHKQFVYVIKSGNTEGRFAVDNDGFIKLAASLDYEGTKSYSLEIEARDTTNPSIVSNPDAVVTVTVLEVNDNRPVFGKSLYNKSTSESTPIGTSVLQITATDADDGVAESSLEYIALLNTTHFALNKTTGVITVAVPLDYETMKSYYLTAIVTDKGDPALTARTLIDFTITDQNDNIPVFDQQTYSNVVSEKAPFGQSIITVAASDMDSGENGRLTYSIRGQQPMFKINPNTGVITLNGSLDYETTNTPIYTLLIDVSDNGTPKNSATTPAVVTINVRDVNDKQPVFSLDKYTFTIPENMAANQIISLGVTVAATDGDATGANNQLTYKIVNTTDSGLFGLQRQGNNILIMTATGASFDYETKKMYSFEIEATDSASEEMKGRALVTVMISDINDNPPILNTANIYLNISEATLIGTPLVTIMATDKDSGNNGKLVYNIINGDPTTRFLLERDNGILILRNQLDSFTTNKYELDFSVQDGVNTALGKIFINVLPVDLTLLHFNHSCPLKTTIPENTVMSNVLTLQALDSGAYVSRQLNYTINSDPNDINTMFRLNSTTGEITQIQQANYEQRSIYDMSVCAQNERGAKICCYVSIRITDVNERPVFVNQNSGVNYLVSITEATIVDTTIFTVFSEDPDFKNLQNGQTSYSLSLPAGQETFFYIDQNGHIILNTTLDRETLSTYTFSVIVADNHPSSPLQSSTQVTVLVTDYNDERPIIQPISDINIAENSANQVVRIVAVSDQDLESENRAIQYSISPPGILTISNNGALTVNGSALDYEKVQSYTLYVTAKDSGSPYLSATSPVVVNVLNVNDNDPYFLVNSYNLTVSEKTTVGTLILPLFAQDNDLGAFGEISSYIIIGGNAGDKFEITGTELKLKGELNWDNIKTYTLTIIAIDNGSVSSRQSPNPLTVTINVDDYSELQPFFLQNLYVDFIREDIPTNSLVLVVNASSNEPIYGPLSYAIVPNLPDTNSFRITPSGEIRTVGGFNYETKNNYTFDVEVTDTYNGRKNRASVYIHIIDLNDEVPAFTSSTLSKTTYNITEFTLPGSVITCLSATDRDSGQNGRVQYRAIGGDGSGIFNVETDGKILLSQHIYFDRKNQYNLNVEAYDLGTPEQRSSPLVLTIYLHKSYTGVATNDVSISENTQVGQFVAKVSSTDPFSGNSNDFRYYLVGKSNTSFRINDTTGEIFVRAPLDREQRDRHVLTIQSRGPTTNGVGELVVTVIDVNDNPPIFNPRNYQVTVSESINVGFPLVTVTATDADEGPSGVVTYSIVAGNTSLFAINPATGSIRLLAALDHETSQVHILTIQARDGGTPSRNSVNNAAVTIIVQDYNDNCPVFAKNVYTGFVNETALTGTEILRATVTDNDRTNNNIVSCMIDEPLAINFFSATREGNDCVVRTSALLDYETNSQYRFVLKATDNGVIPCQVTTNVIIDIGNLPDVNPFFQPQNYTINIPESTLVGTILLSLKVISPVSSLTFTLHDINEPADLDKFMLTQQDGELVLKAPVDYETKSQYRFTATVNDGANNGDNTANITVNILDVNDNAPIFNQTNCYSTAVVESTPVGSSLATVFASDLDTEANKQITYSLLQDSACSNFVVNSTNGVITLLTQLDYESRSEHYCIITAFDAGVPSLSSKTCVKFTVLNINDNKPIFNPAQYNITILENKLVGSFVVRAIASDNDPNNVLTYTIQSGNTGNRFSINPSSGVITIQNPLDYENTKLYSLAISAVDNQILPEVSNPNAMVYITVLEVNDNKPTFLENKYEKTIPENTGVGASVLQVNATDNDHGILTSRFTFIALENTNDFIINPSTGIITVARPLDYETQKLYKLVAVAQDLGSPSLTGRTLVDITITDVNDNVPMFNPTLYNVRVSEKAPVATSLTQVFARDMDDGLNGVVTYQISAGNDASKFSINNNTGVIALVNSLNREDSVGNYNLTVSVSDRGSPPENGNKATVLVSVVDVNDKEPVFVINEYTFNINEGLNSGTVVGTVTASDNDISSPNNNINYSIVSSADSGNFSIISGTILSASVFNFEQKISYQFEVEATDQAVGTNNERLTGRALVKVFINDVNDNDPSVNNIVLNISEATLIGTMVTRLNASDIDSGENARLTYLLLTGGATTFGVNINNGYITLLKQLDYYTQNNYTLQILVRDNGSPQRSAVATVTIYIHPVDLTLLDFTHSCPISYTLPENTQNNATMNVKADDTGSYDSKTIRYSIESNVTDISTMFTLVPNTGSIIQLRQGNHEERSRYDMMICARNERGSEACCHVTIHIEDQNESPYFTNLNNGSYTVDVLETTPKDTVIYSVVTEDEDFETTPNGQRMYSVVTQPGEEMMFAIDQYGRISTNATLDRESKARYNFTVVVTDKGNPPLSNQAEVIVNVLDYNDERPNFILLNNHTTPENGSSTIIGTVVATDDDLGTNREIMYSILPPGMLQISNNGQLSTVPNTLDYERAQKHTFYITATDKGSPYLSTTKSFVLTITNINDNVPYFPVNSYNLTVSEKTTVGTLILPLFAQDNDLGAFGEISSYIIIGGNAGDKFEITGTELKLKGELNWDNIKTYTLTIIAIDNGSVSSRQSPNPLTVTINVDDYSELQPFFLQNLYVDFIREDIPTNSLVLVVNASSNEPIYGPLSYAIVPNLPDTNSFRITPSGEIRTVGGFNYETKNNYTFDVEVTDTYNGRKNRASVYIHIIDLNDEVPAFTSSTLSKTTYNITEFTLPGSVITCLSATDRDSGQNGRVQYRAIGGDGSGIFNVETDGKILLSQHIYFDRKNQYNLNVEAYDLGTPEQRSSPLVLTIYLHKSYTGVATNDVSISENTQVGQFVAKVSSTDPFSGNSNDFRYYLVGKSNTSFRINDTTGEIFVRAPLDREQRDRHVLTIQSRGPTTNGVGELVVTVIDVNDNSPIFNPATYQVTVSESANTGLALLTVTATDVDEGPSGVVTYSISAGNTSLFGINQVTGIISLTGALDYENQVVHQLTIQARDSGTPSRISTNLATVIVIVQDYNDNCPTFENSTYMMSIVEPGILNQLYLSLTVRDRDSDTNGQFACSIDEPLATEFFQMSADCKLSLIKQLDYEQHKYFRFVAKATDRGTVPCQLTTNIIVQVGDRADVLPVFLPQNYEVSIPESTTVGTMIAALKVESPVTQLTYTLFHVNDPDDLSKFRINSATGEIYLQDPVDREIQDQYQFTANVNDGFNNAVQRATITINILDVNDNHPFFNKPTCYERSLSESSSNGTLVVDSFAFDNDLGRNSEVTYSMLPSPTCTSLVIDEKSGRITLSGALDYEQQKVHHCLIRADDNGTNPLSGYACLTLTVNNANDNKPVFAIDQFNVTVQESVPVDTLIASLHATDMDNLLSITYSIVGGDPNLQFKIDNNGKLRTRALLDYEAIKSYALEIQAQDNNGQNSSPNNAMVYVTVLEVNDNRPQFLKPYYKISIPENTTVGASILNVSAFDNDHGTLTRSFFYSALENTTDFAVNPSNGVITVASTLDYETNKHYELVVAVQDRGTPYLSNRTLVDIEITDVNDNAPRFTEALYTRDLSERALVGASVVSLKATDADESDTLVFTITSVQQGPEGFFTVDGNTIKLAQELDYENATQRRFTLQVQVQDSRNRPGINNAIVILNVKDINDREPTFTLNIYTVDVTEGNDISQPILQVQANDRDGTNPNRALIYTIVQGQDDADSFAILTAGQQGLIFSRVVFDYETKKQYQFSIMAYDQARENFTAVSTVYVNVLDRNDEVPIPEKDLIIVNISEATRVLSTIAIVFAHDNDTGVNSEFTYQLTNHPEDKFEITDRGVIRLKSQLDYHTQSFYNFTVFVLDKGTPRRTSKPVTVLVYVHRVELAGIKFQRSHYIFNITEKRINSVGSIRAVDSGDYISKDIEYSVSSGLSLISNKFMLSGNTILQTTPVNYTNRHEYNFVVKAINERGSTDYAQITINIRDINERPYFVGLTPRGRYEFTMSEVISVPSYIYAVVAKDDDTGTNGEMDYELISNFVFGNFTIDQYGRIQVLKDPDQEFTDSYEFQVRATDRGNPPLSSNLVSVVISVLDYNDNRPAFHPSTPMVVQVRESQNGSDIGNVFANDTDAGQNGIVKYTAINPEGHLSVNYDTGAITIIKPFDYETARHLEFVVVAQDLGSPFLSAYRVIKVDVLNDNDEHPYFPVLEFNITVSEKTPVGSRVLVIPAADNDDGPAGHIAGYTLTFVNPINGSGAGGPNDAFMVNNMGEIFLQRPLDSRMRHYYQYNVSAMDGGSPQRSTLQSATIHIYIADYSEEQPTFDLNPYIIQVSENIFLMSNITKVRADSVEPIKGPFMYSILPNNDSMKFVINSSTGEITNNGSFDYEMKRKYAFLVEAKDMYNNRTGRTLVIVYILDINDNIPIITTIDPQAFVYNISDATYPGSVVAKVNGMDADSGENGKVVFTITGGDGQGTFAITSDGYVTLTGALDSRVKTQYILAVRATDQGVPSLFNNKVLTFNVGKGRLQANTVKFHRYHYKACINENQASANLIQVNASNANPVSSSTIAYALDGTVAERQPFAINSQTGIIFLPQGLDYEAKREYNFIVTAINNEGSRDIAIVSICINDTDDHSPKFVPASFIVNMSESARPGFLVYKTTVLDDDLTDFNMTRTYTIEQGNLNDKFMVNQMGHVLLKSMIDYEALQVKYYDLRIRVTEGSKTGDMNLRVNILDWNDVHPSFSTLNIYNFSIPENKGVGEIIEILTAVDRDATAPNNNLTYRLLTTDDDFILETTDSGHGSLKVNAPLDYSRRSKYEFVALAQDRGYLNLKGTALVIINIIDVNNHAPVFESLMYNNTISEHSRVGTKVIQVHAHDRDTGDGGRIIYTINDPSNTFIIDQEGFVILNKTLDYETKRDYALEVSARDGENLVAANMSMVYIRVSEVNDNEPTFDLSLYRQSFAEDTPLGSLLFTLRATDNDIYGNNITYSIPYSNIDTSYVEIDSKTGNVTLRRSLDYEDKKLITFSVEAIDNNARNQLTGLTHVIIDVTDVNDNNPVFVYGNGQSSYNVTVTENLNVPSIVAVVDATDRDSGNNAAIRYHIVGGNEDNKFFLQEINGQISLIDKLNALQKNKYVLTIMAKDLGNPSRSTNTTVTINVKRYFESIPQFIPNYIELIFPENQPINSTLYTLFVNKTLPGSPFTLSFHNSSIFEEFELKGNNITLVKNFDYEKITNYRLIILATDRERDTAFAQVIIKVQNLNEFTPEFTQQTFFAEVSELAFSGHSVLTLSATDGDRDFTELFYTIIDPIPNDAFRLARNTIVVSGPITRGETYRFKVSAFDGTFTSVPANVIINVVAENLPVFVNTTYTISLPENYPLSANFLNVSAGSFSGIAYIIASAKASQTFMIDTNGKCEFSSI